MGSGPGRQEEVQVEARALEPQVDQALRQALAQLDRINPTFKATREEERNSQLTKVWTSCCRDIDGWLRSISKTLHESHQLTLDTGAEGGGRNMRPFVEETGRVFDRLVLRLDDEEVVATFGKTELLRGPLARLSYEWVEEAVITWVLTAVESQTGHG